MLKTRWTPWMARYSTDVSYACKWRATAGRQTPTTAVVGDRLVDTVDTDGGVAVAVPGAGGTAVPAAGVALAPEADLATAAPDPGPTPGLDPGPRAAHPAGARPNLLPGPDPSPSLLPGAALPSRTERLNPSPDPGLGADPNPLRPTEPPRSPESEYR